MAEHEEKQTVVSRELNEAVTRISQRCAITEEEARQHLRALLNRDVRDKIEVLGAALILLIGLGIVIHEAEKGNISAAITAFVLWVWVWSKVANYFKRKDAEKFWRGA
jgi:hypothetical protein